jgi:hypothetical protein
MPGRPAKRVEHIAELAGRVMAEMAKRFLLTFGSGTLRRRSLRD